MVKTHFYQQLSIEDGQDAMENYDDDHYNEFYDLLINHLLINIRKIPFDSIINNYLVRQDNPVYKTKKAYCLFWLYSADRHLINSKTVYSFRFANACNPVFYQTFETKAHHLFISIPEKRHRSYGWCEHIGKDLLDEIDKYLNIKMVVENHHPHTTKLFINQKCERLDIQFNFDSLNERIAITFEPGYPACPDED